MFGLKKYIRDVAAVGAVAAVACVPQLANSATDNAALNLSGSVAAVVDVSVSGTAIAASLDLSVNHTGSLAGNYSDAITLTVTAF